MARVGEEEELIIFHISLDISHSSIGEDEPQIFADKRGSDEKKMESLLNAGN